MTQKIQVISIIIAVIASLVFFSLGLSAPKTFPEGERFEITEGEGLQSISERLEEKGIIGSALLFRGWVSLLGKDSDIDLGVYHFDDRMTLGGVVAKIVRGPDEPLLSVTIPEGYTTKQIADAFDKALPTFSTDIFGEIVYRDKLDGYLFPSTYYPLPSSTEEDITRLMKSTFEREYEKHFKDESFPRYVPTRQDVVSLAAILEGEANTEKDMKLVSGILQKRLKIGMRLQVDVAEVTYRKSGIPEQPISSPGVVALTAVFHPTDSPYLYYLTGKDGKMYYAKTFEEHKRNIQKYLR